MGSEEHKSRRRWPWWLAFAFAAVLTVAALLSAKMGHDLQTMVINDNHPEIFGLGGIPDGQREALMQTIRKSSTWHSRLLMVSCLTNLALATALVFRRQ